MRYRIYIPLSPLMVASINAAIPEYVLCRRFPVQRKPLVFLMSDGVADPTWARIFAQEYLLNVVFIGFAFIGLPSRIAVSRRKAGKTTADKILSPRPA